MQLERIAVAVRPRSGWESIDLGFQMARMWWKQTWAIWLALYVPVAALALALSPNKFYAVVFLWWLKPLFDRAVLYGLSRLVFGEHVSVASTIAAAREWLRPGLVLALSVRRFELARSFALPVTALEKQTGKPARERRAVLGSRLRGTAVWLTVVCIHLEMIAMLSLFSLGDLLIPSAGDLPGSGENGDSGRSGFFGLTSWTLTEAICYAAAVSLIEPLYVAAGFSLYLNRRTFLEGWDLEIRLRQIGNRLKAAANATATVILCATLVALVTPETVIAGESALEPSEVIADVLEDPVFEQHREVERWRSLKRDEPEEEETNDLRQAWRNFALFLSDISQGLAWAGMIIGAGALLYILYKFAPAPRIRNREKQPPIKTLFGLNIAPESLPDDVAAAASDLAREGRLREALSLLYRGALAALVHRYRIRVRAGDTENECADAASTVLGESGATYFRKLVAAWQQLAYGEHAPAQLRIDALCHDWNSHFSTAPQPVAGGDK